MEDRPLGKQMHRIEVLRWGHRPRDYRLTTHVALTARALGASGLILADVEDKGVREKIYQQYLKAFQVGAYNFIKEEYDIGEKAIIPRKYFSGGMWGLADISLERSNSPVDLDPAQVGQLPRNYASKITVALLDIGTGASSSPIKQTLEQDQISSGIFKGIVPADEKNCRCGDLLRGLAEPSDCQLFGTACTPSYPIGPCMVSIEGSCNIEYKYGRSKNF